MDFFQRQDDARYQTRFLVWIFIAATCITAGLVGLFTGWALSLSKETANDRVFLSGLATAATLLFILGVSAFRTWQLRADGGRQIAEALGGSQLDMTPTNPLERRFLHVVEEMAIASGMPMPTLYVLRGESGINAFAAGWTHDTAVIAVTRGCLERLDRDELQGVIGHEFSHILNGDMRMSLRLIGILAGLLALVDAGQFLLRMRGSVTTGNRQRQQNPLIFFGFGLLVLGGISYFIGQILKAAISRSREHLADASAVQFTRNTSGLAGALKKIGATSHLGYIESGASIEASHLFIVNAMQRSYFQWFATHPPIEDRIRALDPHWDGTWPIAQSVAPLEYPPPPATPAPTAQDQLSKKLPSEQPSSAQQMAFAPIAETVSWQGRGRFRQSTAASIPAPTLTNRIGAEPDPASIDASALALRGFSKELQQALGDSFSARSLVTAACADSDPASAALQWDYLTKLLETDAGDSHFLRDVRRYYPLVHGLGPAGPLTIIHLSGPALRRMVGKQRQRFATILKQFMMASGMLSVRDVALLRCVLGTICQPTPIISQLERDPQPALIAIAALAVHDQDPGGAFKRGVRRMGLSTELTPPDCSGPILYEAFDKLTGLTVGQRRLVMDGCASTVAHDGQLTVPEAEILRSVAMALGLPMPPFAKLHDIASLS